MFKTYLCLKRSFIAYLLINEKYFSSQHVKFTVKKTFQLIYFNTVKAPIVDHLSVLIYIY